jgi:hypothetical protein
MPRFVVLYRAPLEVAERFATATPEEAMAGMQLWQKWFARVGPAVVHAGRPLGNARIVTRDGVAAGGTDVIGMMILQADSLDAAVELVRDHHHLSWSDSCSITVLEEQAIPEEAAGLTTVP